MAKGKIPLRMCIACREMKPKKEMLRVVKNADGEIYPDYTGKAPGRGAYICVGEECRTKLNSKKLLHKAFAAAVPQEVYVKIEEGKDA
ncbi:MAG: YlxR family protein [Clostridia bacterium]|nr:YlxR family protein [Clostridia bacterium]